MYKNNKLRGYALITTIYVCSICLLILLFSYKAVLIEREKAEYIKKYIISSTSSDDIKECLLTKINHDIEAHVTYQTQDAVHEFLINNENIKKFIYDDGSFIKYSSAKDCFIIYSYFNESSHKEDYYNYTVSDNKITYKFFNGIFVDGRVDSCI